MRILVLGGYGNTGRRVCELLLRSARTDVVVAGRDLYKASAACDRLNAQTEGSRAIPIAIDASEPAALARACRDIDLLFVASATGRHTMHVARAAMESGTDYMDVVFSSAKKEALKSLEPEIRNVGRCFITDGGFHPGLPAAVARFLALGFDTVDSAVVASLVRADWKPLDLSPSTMDEFATEFGQMKPKQYRDGAWSNAGLMSAIKVRNFDFGSPFGEEPCVPMFLDEMRAIPEQHPDMSECGFWIAGFNHVVDWLITPVVALSTSIAPGLLARPMGQLMYWGLKRFSGPPLGTVLIARVTGVVDGVPATAEVRLSHDDGYWFTAIPAVACLLQYMDGTIRKPGLWLQATCVDPVRMMEDMQQLGIRAETSRSVEVELATTL